MINSSQTRAARGLIAWTQAALADAAGISLSAVRDFEGDKRSPISRNLLAMQTALEAAGVQFLSADENGGPGVRLRQ